MVRRRDLGKWYDDEGKAEKIYQMRLKAGLVSPDEDFPDDPMENWVWIKSKTSYKVSNETEERMTAKGQMQLDSSTGAAFLGEGGILAAGACPSVTGLKEEGQEKIAKLMGGVAAAKKPPLPKPNRAEAEVVTADTPKERAVSAMREMVQESAEGKRLLMEVAPYGISGDLFEEIRTFTAELDAAHKKAQKLVLKGCDNEAKYLRYTSILAEKRSWWSMRKDAAKGVEKVVLPPKKKAKREPKAKPEKPEPEPAAAKTE